MDQAYEVEIIKSFFEKKYHDRIIYELASRKKRKHGIGRLSHQVETILDKRFMCEVKKTSPEEILDLLRKAGADELCYVISFHQDADGKYMPLEEGIHSVFYAGMPSLVICNLKLAYYEGEQCYGPPPRYLLINDLFSAKNQPS